MNKFSLIFISLFVSACSTTDMRPALERGMGGIPTTQYAEATTVEEIRALRPQAQFPLSIAVMPAGNWRTLSQEERSVIEKWGDELNKLGFARRVDIVPQSLIPSCGYKRDSGCFLKESRLAGARMQADAILFINDSTVTDRYLNPLSILNLTIVGMWIAPAHHRDSYSIYESALFDINNGYLYAIAEGRGAYKTVRPYMYTQYDTGQDKARLEALNDVGMKLLALAKEQMARINAP